jgi:hypothetical protein
MTCYLLKVKSQVIYWSSFRFIIYYITLTYNTLITIKFLGYYKYNEFII